MSQQKLPGFNKPEQEKEYKTLKQWIRYAKPDEKRLVQVHHADPSEKMSDIFVSIGNKGRIFKANKNVELDAQILRFLTDKDSCGIPKYRTKKLKNGMITHVTTMVPKYIVTDAEEEDEDFIEID